MSVDFSSFEFIDYLNFKVSGCCLDKHMWVQELEIFNGVFLSFILICLKYGYLLIII